MKTPDTQSLTVELGERSYPITIGKGIAGDIKSFIKWLTGSVALVTDIGVAQWQQAFIKQAFGQTPTIVLPSGEKTKSLASLADVYDFLVQSKLDRNSSLFVIGGGVMGDLAGMAAGTYLRGIDFYQVPTTLLAMVDSSVGGKTSVNIPAGKNLVGVFHQPKGVFIDVDFLKTLPEREFSAGMAEVVKCGLLADRAFFDDLRKHPVSPIDTNRLIAIIHRSCAIKASLVQEDEREDTSSTGGRALLNLGHTFGHAIEVVAGYGEYLHGEAVSIGLCLAACLSHELGYISEQDVTSVYEALTACGLPTTLRSPLNIDDLIDAMYRDKKTIGGNLRFVVMQKIGHAVVQGNIDLELVKKIWKTVGCF